MFFWLCDVSSATPPSNHNDDDEKSNQTKSGADTDAYFCSDRQLAWIRILALLRWKWARSNRRWVCRGGFCGLRLRFGR